MRAVGPGLTWGPCRERAFRVCVLLVFAAYVGGGAARAAPASGDDAIARGLELRRSARDAEALEEFKRAYQLSPSPRALAQMGWAEQALGRWVDAEAHLDEALKAKGDPWVHKVHGRIEQSLAALATHLGSLEVTGSPAGADVNVDGRKVGTLPLRAAIRVPAGDVVLEVRAADFRPISRTVDVRARLLSRETVTLVAVETAPPTVSAVAVPKARAESDAVAVPAAAETPPPRPVAAIHTEAPAQGGDGGGERGSWRGPTKWVAAGAAVLMAGAGVTGVVLHEQKVSAFGAKTDPTTMVKRCSNGASGVTGGDDCVSLANAANRWQDVAIAGFVAAGVFAAGALILQLTDDHAPAPSAAGDGRSVATARGNAQGLRLACEVNPLARGAACAVRF
jgi:hypothetical protein